MPAPIIFAHKPAKRLTDGRDGTLPYLRPDGKTQVTVEYDEEGRIIRIDTVLIPRSMIRQLHWNRSEQIFLKHVITPVLPADSRQTTKPSISSIRRADSSSAAPHGDAGLTGRKSSSTPTAVMRVTAEAHFPAKILQS